MAAAVNGLPNGRADALHSSPEPVLGFIRFSDVPHAIDIPVSGGDSEEAVEVGLEELLDDPTELCTLLENENVAKTYWTTIALAYAKQDKVDHAIEIINRGLGALDRTDPNEKLSLYNCLCWLHLLKCREAPRVRLDAKSDPDVKTKEYYLRAATSTLNDASRISPSYPPLFLARGVLCLLRAALLQDQTEKTETLRQSMKCFDDSFRTSRGKNMMAVLGKAKAAFSLGKYPEALQGYQQVLERSPDQIDPDPRIGIGCCYWQLGYKDDAQAAWQRALDINPNSKIANILLGLYFLNSSSQYATTDPEFSPLYKKAMVEFTQKAFKLDSDLPLACATFGSYFFLRKAMPKVETLSRKAIELTDVNAIASDGWYLLARKEHHEGDLARASEYYLKADQARGGEERGYLPAKFGAIQLRVLQNDIDGAKFRLEKLVQQTKNVEAMALLGTLFADDVFSTSSSLSREDQAVAARKAVSLLEAVRASWKESKRNIQPDSSVLLNLARLYETHNPEKALQYLQQVEQMEIDEVPDDARPSEEEDEATATRQLREQLPPQLLNNLACFHFQADRHTQARELFETALDACKRLVDKDQTIDADALVTTISFNLARTYEAENMLDQAKAVYEGLLERHEDYVDARARLTYIALRQNPSDDGPKSMAQLYEADSANLEVRSLYGWYLRKAKRQTANVAEDQEQRHYKHTLQNFDKHDRYALTGMGNLYLTAAREIRRGTDQDKRRKLYERAVEFFDKALQLDPRNAYAAQGIGIAMVEDKKDFAAALQIFSKVKETVKESSVFVNLGHVYCEVKQYARAIESYEAALAKDRARDPQILACLGRAWLLRGKSERSVQAMKQSLEYSQRALQVAPDQVHFRFNVAFVQIQIAQLLYQLPVTQRTLQEVLVAAAGLDEAIDSFSAIAKSPDPPFPKHDIEQRANMGRNTMRRQLERAVQNQREHEEQNAERLAQAREKRKEDVRRREEEIRAAEAEREERMRRLKEDREAMIQQDRELTHQRAALEEEEKRRKEEEYSVDEETGERRKKVKKSSGKRKKKDEDFIDDTEEGGHAAGASRSQSPGQGRERETTRSKKRRRLQRSKYKSDERVVDSDDDDMPMDDANDMGETFGESDSGGAEPQVSLDEQPSNSAARRKAARVIEDDDEDEDE